MSETCNHVREHALGKSHSCVIVHKSHMRTKLNYTRKTICVGFEQEEVGNPECTSLPQYLQSTLRRQWMLILSSFKFLSLANNAIINTCKPRSYLIDMLANILDALFCSLRFKFFLKKKHCFIFYFLFWKINLNFLFFIFKNAKKRIL